MVQQAANEVFGEQPLRGIASRFPGDKLRSGAAWLLGALVGAMVTGALGWWWQAPPATGLETTVALAPSSTAADPPKEAETKPGT